MPTMIQTLWCAVVFGFWLTNVLQVAFAQDDTEDETPQEIMKGITSSFALPLRDLLKKEYPSEWRNLFSGFSGGFAFNAPLQETTPNSNAGSGSQGERATNMTFTASLKYNPLSYWFMNVTYYHYFDENRKASWNPDFSYVFGYDDWHPYTFSLVYSNYGGNRLNPDRDKKEKFTRIEEGVISLGWKYRTPRFLEYLFIVHESGGMGGSINYNVVPRYSDLATLSKKQWKQTVSASLKYAIYKNFYLNVTFIAYPFPKQQQPWDPDFTYGFGYFDWHPGSVSVQYNNYSGNRFPWKQKAPGTGLFTTGGFTISWSWAW
ncbi:MAG: hypothetical protein HYZ50_17365 [Deltaproteobacteria bacterium]|nr:hypothetical protein [Deltaproteobacteria bacterium]